MIERTGMLSIQLMLLEKKECGFDELATLPIARGSLSKRLQELRKLGFIERRAEGKRKFYRLSEYGKKIARDLRKYMDNAKVIADMTMTRDHLFNDVIPRLNESVNSLVDIINVIDNSVSIAVPAKSLSSLELGDVKEAEVLLQKTERELEIHKQRLLEEKEREENPRMRQLLENVGQKFSHVEKLYEEAYEGLGKIKKLSRKLK